VTFASHGLVMCKAKRLNDSLLVHQSELRYTTYEIFS